MGQQQGPVGLKSSEMVFGDSENHVGKELDRRELPPTVILDDELRSVKDDNKSDILHTFRPAIRSFIPVMLITLILVLTIIKSGDELVAVLDWLQGRNMALGVTHKNILLWRWLVVLASILFVYLWVEIGRANSRLIVYKDHIEVHKGIVARKRTTLAYTHIRTVDTNQKVLERLFGIGTVSIGSSATAGHEIMIGRLKDPLKIRKIINEKLT